MSRLLLSLLSLALLSVPAPAAPTQKDVREAIPGQGVPVEVRCEAYLKRYERAHLKWRTAVNEADEEQRATLLEAHPARDFLAYFDAMAREGSGPAMLFLLEHLPRSHFPAEAVAGRRCGLLDEICVEFVDEEWTTGLGDLVWSLWLECDRDRVTAALMPFVYQTANGDARQRVGMELASRLGFDGRGPDDAEAAKALFEHLLKDAPEGATARRIKGKLFRLENLQMGMTAPELVAKDVDDNEISLSSHRGKVVVVDFWGFW